MSSAYFPAQDPWTKIEGSTYPHAPYFMSEHLSLSALQETDFYKHWLAPQGVCECVVAEIYLGLHTWVALNLLFDATAIPRQKEILTELELALPIMRKGWHVGERLLNISYGQAAAVSYLESTPVPCLVLDEDFIVQSVNARGLAEFGTHLPLTLVPSIGVSLPLRGTALGRALTALLHASPEAAGEGRSASVPSLQAGYQLQITRLAFGEDVLGKRRAQFLVVAKIEVASSFQERAEPRIWETGGLTRAQSAIVRWIAEGGHATDYAALNGISKKTAYDHLFSARQKLGGISARDIYTSHQSQLAIEG